MTGAGSSQVAFVKADGFLSIPGTPTYYRPGRNITVNDLTLDNVLARLREPGNVESVDSLARNLEGAFGLTYVMSNQTHDDVRDIVFNDAGTGFTNGRTALSRWFLGVDYLTSGGSGTAERVLKGCIPLEYAIDYDRTVNTVQETLTMGYADEEKNTSLTPGTITGPTDGGDVPFHGTTLNVDSAVVSKLQRATLRITNISRFHFGADRVATDAVVAQPTTTLEAAAIYDGDDYLELAYGGSGNTTPQDSISSVTGSLAFDVGGNTVATYTLPELKPDTYTWQDLVNGDADLEDPVTYHVNGGVSIA